jgi:hypothetical protein
VAGQEPGCVGPAVDVGGDDTVQVSPAHDETDGDAAFVDAFHIVGGPGDGVGDAGVDSEGAEVDACVLDGGFGGSWRSTEKGQLEIGSWTMGANGEKGGMLGITNQHSKSCNPQEANRNIAQPSLPCPVRCKSNNDRQYGGNRVWWHAQQLRFRRRITQFPDDGRHEQRKRIQGTITTHVDNHARIGLPVLHRRPEISHLEVFVLGTALLILLQPANHPAPVIDRQKLGFIGEVLHHPEGDDADEDGSNAFQDENPCPTWLAAYTIHSGDGSSEETAKGSSHGGGGEEDCSSHAEFGALVPAGEIIVDAGEEAGFGETKEPPCSGQAGEIGHESHEGHADAPK